jgi:hypothetical protein
VLLLYGGFGEAALKHAQKCHELQPGPESRRLAALAYLVQESWREAAQAGKDPNEKRGASSH